MLFLPKEWPLIVWANREFTSFQIYLRSWAKELGVPILSVDYSLSPEAPFPRASEECFFAYAWCLNNFDQLGTTGKYVCVAGDSAGMKKRQFSVCFAVFSQNQTKTISEL